MYAEWNACAEKSPQEITQTHAQKAFPCIRTTFSVHISSLKAHISVRRTLKSMWKKHDVGVESFAHKWCQWSALNPIYIHRNVAKALAHAHRSAAPRRTAPHMSTLICYDIGALSGRLACLVSVHYNISIYTNETRCHFSYVEAVTTN